MGRFSDIDARTAQAKGWYEASAAIKSEDDDDARAAVVAALDYHFPTFDGPEAPFGPMWQIDGKIYPMPIANFPTTGIDAWREAFEETSNHFVRSRLADLFWIRRVEDAHQYARVAIGEYVEVSHVTDQPMIIADATCRALDLAVQINESSKVSEIVESAFGHMQSLIDSEEWVPGATLRIARKLVGLPSQYSVQIRLSDVLERCLVRYEADPHVVSGIRELQLSLFRDDPEAVRNIARVQVQEWIDSADSHTGLLRLADLEKARDLASAAGLTEELAHVRRLIENSPIERGELQEVSASVSIPAAELHEFENSFFQDDDTMGGFLYRFGGHCPFPVEHDGVEESARSLMQEFPLQYILNNVVLNQEGLPLVYVRTPEEHLEHAVRGQQSARCGIWLSLAAGILDRALAAYGDATEALREHFRTEFIPDELAEVIVRAFDHYRNDRFDECICILLPRLEAIFREMARKVGISIYKEPTSSRPGSYRLLGSLLAEFKGRLPDDFYRYIFFAVGDQLGLNARNRLCHGLMLMGTKQEATLVLHVVSVLAAFRLTSAAEDVAEGDAG